MLLINAIGDPMRADFQGSRDNAGSHVAFEMLPLSIGTLGGVLERSGIAVTLRDDAVHSDREIEDAIGASRVVGISAMTASASRALDLARLAKKHGKTVLVGGPHASCSPGDFLDSGSVDVVVQGEADETIVGLVEALPDRTRWHDVAGIGFWENQRKVFTRPAPLPTALDSIPFPAWHLLPVERYWAHQPRGRTVQLFSSRGCPWACTYCNKLQSTRKYRARSPKNTVDEIEYLVGGFGVDGIYFPDDLFTLYRDRVLGICDEILERGVAVYWTCVTRVDCVDPELLRRMRRAGCVKINYGVESGSPRILEAMKKKFTLEQILAAARMTREAGIRSTFFIIVGFPGETWEDIALTRKMLREARPDNAGVNIFNLLPGTEVYEQYKHLLHDPSFDGINFLDGDDVTGFRHQTFTGEDLRRIRSELILQHKRLMNSPRAELERKLERARWYLT
ncbi:MAG: B12-binding domain-containing radical SAM protein, partial [Candidatus Binatia bacterium]